MFYSRMAEHAIRALGELARLRDEYVSTGLIAELTPTPTPILTKVIARLSHAGLVRTREGRHGGVRLARPPSAITVCEVVSPPSTVTKCYRCAQSSLKAAIAWRHNSAGCMFSGPRRARLRSVSSRGPQLPMSL